MSDEEAQVQSEEEAPETPKRGRGRPKKVDTPASGERELSSSFRANGVIEKLESMLTAFKGTLWGHSAPQLGHILVHREAPATAAATASSSGIIRGRSPPCAAAEADSVLPLHQTGGRDEQEPERISPPIVIPSPTAAPNGTAQEKQEDDFPQAQQQLQDPLESSECEFKVPSLPTGSSPLELFANAAFHGRQEQLQPENPFLEESEFQPSQNCKFAASDFDFLLSKGEGNDRVVEQPRDSLLLKFDPLLKSASATSFNNTRLSVTREEDQEEDQQSDKPEPVAVAEVSDSEFQPAQDFQFATSDFDFLQSKGGGDGPEVNPARDSLLLKFDPLVKAAPPLVSVVTGAGRLSVTREEEPEKDPRVDESDPLVAVEGVTDISQNPPVIILETAPAAEDGVGETTPDHHRQQPAEQQQQQLHQFQLGSVGEGGALQAGLETSGFIAVAAVVPPTASFCADTAMDIDEETKNLQPHCADDGAEADEKMSVDNTMILDGESSTAERNLSLMEPDQDFNGTGISTTSSSNSDQLADKRSKNESLKIEEMQKKLAEAELREETLLKRITEKDKVISKMSGVVEAYERTIADLITQKEQITQNYEKTCESLKVDSDINAQHLESLEKTFSDLHAKYERMKVTTAEHKEREEELVNERNRCEESLRMQEKRYENMKSHAMTQLEIANNKLSELVRNHAQEVTKLKALLKKEEIYRASVNEQLSQKTRENEELVKICEELINGGAN